MYFRLENPKIAQRSWPASNRATFRAKALCGEFSSQQTTRVPDEWSQLLKDQEVLCAFTALYRHCNG